MKSGPLLVKMRCTIINASVKLLALKNTKARVTKANVRATLRLLYKNFGTDRDIFLRVFVVKNSKLTAIPCNNPNIIKVKPAPCHKPLIKNVDISAKTTPDFFKLR